MERLLRSKSKKLISTRVRKKCVPLGNRIIVRELRWWMIMTVRKKKPMSSIRLRSLFRVLPGSRHYRLRISIRTSFRNPTLAYRRLLKSTTALKKCCKVFNDFFFNFQFIRDIDFFLFFYSVFLTFLLIMFFFICEIDLFIDKVVNWIWLLIFSDDYGAGQSSWTNTGSDVVVGSTSMALPLLYASFIESLECSKTHRRSTHQRHFTPSLPALRTTLQVFEHDSIFHWTISS